VKSVSKEQILHSVKFVSENKTKPNWLFRGLIGVSFAVHLVIFMHISGIYNSKALSYIELTMQNISRPSARAIPRPRQRSKAPKPKDVKRLKVTRQLVPRLKPMKLESVEKNLPDSLVEGIAMPDMPDASGLQMADFSPDGSGDYVTSQSYLEMVRLRIERYKKYPDAARTRNVEGRVTIRFIITPDGGVREVEVAKCSRNRSLDLAALKAVQDAAPFPKPPRHLFKGAIPLELMIVFELT
jgi:periplasmic protein TonB